MLYIVSAPSGAGKTSLVRAVVSRLENLVISVSYTTRPARPGEIEGENYHFVTQAVFDQMIQQQDFLEYAKVFDYFYGTSKRWISEQMQKNKDVILEIDWQGASQIRQLFPGSISIFILPPSLEILRQRLKERKQDSKEVIDKRMTEAKSQSVHFNEFEYLVINDDFETAILELQSIVRATRLRCGAQVKKHRALIEKILG